MTSILQISDTHLSPRTGLFRQNLALLGAWAAAARPGLIVVSGDLSLDGAGREADLAFAAGLLRDLPAPLLVLPGNHDVGSDPRTMPKQPVDAARLARFRRLAGEDMWVCDLPGWRLVGLNTEIMGTGLAEEAAQAGFIAAAAAGIGDRCLAVFLHTPAFTTAPDDPAFDYWSVAPEARAALLPLLDHPGLRLVGVRPSAPAPRVYARRGALCLGAAGLLPVRAGDAARACRGSACPARCCTGSARMRWRRPGLAGGMQQHWLEDVRAETYPRSTP